jgi:multimeric flavodoxin WrbA
LKHLLVLYHSQSGHTQALAESVARGAGSEETVACRLLRAFEAGTEDLLWADAVIFGTPENFGYMSGALKDFYDRTYESCREQTEGLPYAVFISAGNDGTGAAYHIERILRGYAMKPVAEALIVRGEVTDQALQQAQELGQTLAAALEMGIC